MLSELNWRDRNPGLIDGTVHMLRADGTSRFVLPRQRARIVALQFLDGGSRLLVGAQSGLVSEWVVDPDELVALARGRTARSPTVDERRVLEARRGR